MLDDALVVVRQRALERRVHLDVRYSGLSVPMRADKRRLKQILFNLLSNAVKFSPDGWQRGPLRATLVEREQAATGIPGYPDGLRVPLPQSDFRQFVQLTVQGQRHRAWRRPIWTSSSSPLRRSRTT